MSYDRLAQTESLWKSFDDFVMANFWLVLSWTIVLIVVGGVIYLAITEGRKT